MDSSGFVAWLTVRKRSGSTFATYCFIFINCASQGTHNLVRIVMKSCSLTELGEGWCIRGVVEAELLGIVGVVSDIWGGLMKFQISQCAGSLKS